MSEVITVHTQYLDPPLSSRSRRRNQNQNMPNKSLTVSAFYDQEPGAPPPFPPMLTDQLELFDSAHRSTMLVADKILPSKISALDPPHTQLKDTVKVSFERSRSNSRTPGPMPSESLSSLESMLDSCSSTLTESLSDDLKIPKPPDEPGRPGRGGYTLNEALDWNPRAYAKFKKFMHNLIEEHLDTTKCASSQDHALLKVVHDKAADAFPDLENYEGFWPLNDMIMMCLKYTSGRARQKKARMVVGKSKSKKNTSKVSNLQ
ncbi:hypothetical protein P692DRAFT_20877834 [Suillus brevipes Sb2]|nr:hypothetical protein P692DRAFT_20877834 [Suillus brevipes Sb2]